jgi:DNA-binding transcriptional regulator YhcF (GntR family)
MEDRLHGRVDRTSGVPLGAQLIEQIRKAVEERQLEPGDRLPSVRELADSAGVNVNTVRAVYSRLEAEGFVRSEHGRGTFVAAGATSGEPPPTRWELREQIATLEATLARLPPPPLGAEGEAPGPGAALLSTDELVEIRDRLLIRLRQLDSERMALLESLERLGIEPQGAQAGPSTAELAGSAGPSTSQTSRRATPSLAGARIRWVGA